jgi:hypothetical protein
MHSRFLPVLWRIVLIPLMGFEFLVLLGVFDIAVDYTKLGLLLTSSAVFLGLEISYHHIQKRFQHLLRWWAIVPVVCVTVFDAAGDYLHWYSTYTQYDMVLHYVGTLAAAAFLWNILTAFFHTSRDRGLLLWATWTTAVTFGVGYELEEYVEDVFTASQRLGDGPDTANDLLMNTLGALTVVAIIVAHRALKRQKK